MAAVKEGDNTRLPQPPRQAVARLDLLRLDGFVELQHHLRRRVKTPARGGERWRESIMTMDSGSPRREIFDVHGSRIPKRCVHGATREIKGPLKLHT